MNSTYRVLMSMLFSMIVASSQPTGKYMLAGVGEANWFTPNDDAGGATPVVGKEVPIGVSGVASRGNLFEDAVTAWKIRKSAYDFNSPREGKPVISKQLCDALKIGPNCQDLYGVFLRGDPDSILNETVQRGLYIAWTKGSSEPYAVVIARISKSMVFNCRIDREDGQPKVFAKAQHSPQNHITTPWETVSAEEAVQIEPAFRDDVKMWDEKIRQVSR